MKNKKTMHLPSSLPLKLVPFFFTVFLSLGVLIHDTQLDSNTLAFISISAVVPVGIIVSISELSLNDQHVHTETFNFAQSIRHMISLEPRLQTRFSEDKKHLSAKKLAFSTSGF